MLQQNESTDQSGEHPLFYLEVLNSEIQEIKKRRFVNKEKEVVSREILIA